MAHFLVVRSGEWVGHSCRLRPGLRIGRSQGGFVIKDITISSLHAEVIKDEDGRLFLADLKSANGLKINGIRVQTVELTPGLVFQVGGVFVEVEAESDTKQPAPKSDGDTWNLKLSEYLERLSKKSFGQIQKLRPLRQPVVLEFVQGLQLGERWVVGYGPRTFGKVNPEFRIKDETAPDLCFEIDAASDGTPVIVSSSSHVLLNGTPVSKNPLKTGDLIVVGLTQIKVGLK